MMVYFRIAEERELSGLDIVWTAEGKIIKHVTDAGSVVGKRPIDPGRVGNMLWKNL